MTTTYEKVLEYVKTVTGEADEEDLLRFCADIGEKDETLSTVPIQFFMARGGDLTRLARAARRLRNDERIGPLLSRFRECTLHKQRWEFNERAGHEFVCLSYKLAIEMAEDLGDTQTQERIDVTARSGFLAEQFAEGE